MASLRCTTTLVGCPGVDSPITNISAESPDQLLYASVIVDPYRPFRSPILGNSEYVDTDCNSVFGPLWAIYDPIVFAETQAMSNLLALAAQLGCNPTTPPEQPNEPTQIYINDAQTATVTCPDGSEYSYTVESGTKTSPPLNSTDGPIWLQAANDWAAAYALYQATALMDCITRPVQPPDITPGGHGTPIIPPPPGTGGTPLLDETFYWCCLGETLDEALNTYTFSGRGNADYTITVTDGAIPPGTTFAQTGPRNCTLSGTPTQAGNWAWKIHAVSTTLPTVTIDVWDNLFVFGLTSGDLPDATEGTAYGPFQFTAAGGNGPNYTFTSSDLPAGFTLSLSGELTSDNSIVAGLYTFTVRTTDEFGAYCEQEVQIVVNNPCADWTTLDWGIATEVNGTFTPSSSQSDSFSATVTSTPCAVNNYGAIYYNGTGCNANVHLVYAGGILPGSGNCVVSVFQVSPYVALLCWVGFTPRATGVYDLPFSLPNTLGVSTQFRVQVSFPGTTGPCTLSGQITNI